MRRFLLIQVVLLFLVHQTTNQFIHRTAIKSGSNPLAHVNMRPVLVQDKQEEPILREINFLEFIAFVIRSRKAALSAVKIRHFGGQRIGPDGFFFDFEFIAVVLHDFPVFKTQFAAAIFQQIFVEVFRRKVTVKNVPRKLLCLFFVFSFVDN